MLRFERDRCAIEEQIPGGESYSSSVDAGQITSKGAVPKVATYISFTRELGVRDGAVIKRVFDLSPLDFADGVTASNQEWTILRVGTTTGIQTEVPFSCEGYVFDQDTIRDTNLVCKVEVFTVCVIEEGYIFIRFDYEIAQCDVAIEVGRISST